MGGTGPVIVPNDGYISTCCQCEGARWKTGSISYEDDQDYYTYRNPCPGEDCMMKIYYRLDEGPVDMLLQVYQGDGLWFDPIAPVSELDLNSSQTGSFGGLAQGDQCFYAYQGHEGDYTISIRDLRPKRDWAPDQQYSICVEKVGNGCFEPPCALLELGCSAQ